MGAVVVRVLLSAQYVSVSVYFVGYECEAIGGSYAISM